MSETQTTVAPREHAEAGRGKHRGEAATAEEPTVPAQGRHRRQDQESDVSR